MTDAAQAVTTTLRSVSPDPDPAPPRLHDLEAEVMTELWGLGEGPVRTVLDALNARSVKQRKYTTIMTIMARLHGKGVLTRERQGRTDIYTPILTAAQYQEARARHQVTQLVDEYGEVALVHFARQMAELDPKRQAALRRLAQS